MGTSILSASARNHGPSEGHTCQLPQYSPKFETPTSLQQRKIRIPVSPRKSSSRVQDPDRSPQIPKTPEEDISQSGPSSETLFSKGSGDQRSHDPVCSQHLQGVGCDRSQSLIASLGHRATAHDTYLGDNLPEYGGRELADEHRLEAAATLAYLLRSTFFENAKTLNEKINLLTALWTSIREDNEYITTISGSVGAKQTPAQIEKITRKSESVAVSQSLDKELETKSNSKSLISGDDSAPKTPDSHGLKRKSSNLTPPTSAGLPRPPDTTGVTTELYRLSLGVPPTFNPNNSPEHLSSSPTESRRIRPCFRRITSENDLRPAKFAKPSTAGGDLNLSITDDDGAISSVGLQDSPSYILGNKHDENDDPYGPFTKSDHDAMILTRNALLPAGNRYAKISHSGFRAEGALAQDSKGSQCHNDRPTVRKLAPYTKRPPKTLAPEMIICEAIIKPLTKPEMGIAWKKTSSGTWIEQTSHAGWIYIYQLPNEVNTVKIGITQVSIEGRLDSWTEQCGHKTQIAYPSTESERKPVPNIYRLEALVQAELAASRLEEMECSCGKRHIEWFEEALTHARKVVVKWSEWMRTNPYKEVQPRYWHLSPQYIPELAELSRPSPRDPAEGSAINPIRI